MDHDAHVRAYHRHLIGKAVYQAALIACRLHVERRVRGIHRESRVTGVGRRWTWKNHLAHWINKTVKLLEKWGI